MMQESPLAQPPRQMSRDNAAPASDTAGNRWRIQAMFFSNPDRYPPIINSTRLLVQTGFTVDIFCVDLFRRARPVWYPPQAHIHRFPAHSRSARQNYRQYLVRVFAHANNSAALFVGHDMMGLLPARLLATRYRRPLVYHCHDFLERDTRLPLGTRLIRAFEQHFARTADIVIVPDAERAAVVAQALHLARPPLVVANAPLSTPPATRAALYRALAAQGKQFARIVFRQGQIGDGHALEATMQSIPLWQSDQWGFVLMGPGQPAYLAHLTRLAHELGIEHQFAILPPVIYDEIHQFTAGADVGHGLYNPIHINHTYYTTASNKIMEYMAAGLPLLVSNMPGVRRLIETHQCGLGADENDPASIAMGINTLLGNPQQARAMGKAARRAFEAEFCYERQFVPMGEAFHRLIIAQK